GMYFNGPIPDCADAPFAYDGIFEIGERVIIDGCEYVRTSRDTVRITPNGSPIPQTVNYLGRTYKVTK
ncbi:MAG: hypothetical protein II370_07865, partial [Clostridia bacterium]|nr:hypothetical protein [Clostridia bacterium]